MKPMACQKIYQKLAPWLSSAAVLLVMAERLNAYAQVMNESNDELTVIGEVDAKKFANIKTKQDACKAFENQIVTYYDKTSFVLSCVQRPVNDPDVLNELTQRHKKKLMEVPARVYRLIPFGAEYTTTDLMSLKRTSSRTKALTDCKQLDGKYVTANAARYYFVENCAKRVFLSYFDLENHNTKKQSITSVPEETLDEMKDGKPMPSRESEFGILYKMDGDSNWSQLSRNKDSEQTLSDSPDSLRKIERDSKKVNLNELCKKINKHFTSFYSELYFVDGCILHPIKEIGMEHQRTIDTSGGIVDLTPEQMRVLKKGKPIATGDAVKAMKK